MWKLSLHKRQIIYSLHPSSRRMWSGPDFQFSISPSTNPRTLAWCEHHCTAETTGGPLQLRANLESQGCHKQTFHLGAVERRPNRTLLSWGSLTKNCLGLAPFSSWAQPWARHMAWWVEEGCLSPASYAISLCPYKEEPWPTLSLLFQGLLVHGFVFT